MTEPEALALPTPATQTVIDLPVRPPTDPRAMRSGSTPFKFQASRARGSGASSSSTGSVRDPIESQLSTKKQQVRSDDKASTAGIPESSSSSIAKYATAPLHVPTGSSMITHSAGARHSTTQKSVSGNIYSGLTLESESEEDGSQGAGDEGQRVVPGKAPAVVAKSDSHTTARPPRKPKGEKKPKIAATKRKTAAFTGTAIDNTVQTVDPLKIQSDVSTTAPRDTLEARRLRFHARRKGRLAREPDDEIPETVELTVTDFGSMTNTESPDWSTPNGTAIMDRLKQETSDHSSARSRDCVSQTVSGIEEQLDALDFPAITEFVSRLESWSDLVRGGADRWIVIRSHEGPESLIRIGSMR